MAVVNILLRRSTSADWLSSNPILLEGEVGVETDSKKLKVGDGLTTWVSLPYITLTPAAASSLYATINNPNFTGTVTLGTGVNLVFEGATANDFETTLQVSDPTADRTLTLPDVTGTLATQDYVTAEIGTHSSDTTSVHGITDTAELATKSYADTSVSTHSSDTTSVHGIADTAELATKAYADTAASTSLSTHTTDTLDVHGIVDTSLLVTTSGTQTLTNKTLTSPKINEDVAVTSTATELNILDGVTASTAELNILDGVTATATELNYVDGVTSAIQTQLNDKAPLNSPSFTGTVGGLTKSMVGLGNVDDTSDANKPVSTATQAALDLKAPKADPTFTGTVSGVTKTHVGLGNVDNTSDASKPVSTAQQTALDLKANLNAPTFTGTVSGITKAHVGLDNVDNTSDVNKPVSTATQTALDAKLALAGGTMTGALTLSADPSASLHAATKQYVDNTASGVVAKPSVLGATTANIDATYNNGTLGVGATLTHNTNGVFPSTAGGATGWAVGTGILVKNQTNKAHNGRYFVSNMGSVSTPYVLTRCSYCDEASEIPGAYIFVQGGTFAGTGWIQVVAEPATFVVGTDNIDVFQFSGSGTITAGTGITVSGNEVSISTGAITSSLILDGTIVDGDINASAAIAQSKISGLSTSLSEKAPLADPTFTGTVSGITKSMVGLGNVDNTADASKPVSTAQQTALDAKLDSATAATTYAPLASPTFTGTVTVAASGVAFTDGAQTKEGVPSRTPIVQKTASYELSTLTHRDSLIEVNSASATTVTIPTDATLNYPIGTTIDILQTNTGQVTIAAATPGTTTVNSTPGLKLRTQWSSCTLMKRAANTWVVFGDLTA